MKISEETRKAGIEMCKEGIRGFQRMMSALENNREYSSKPFQDIVNAIERFIKITT